MELFGTSWIGKVRQQNQDQYAYGDLGQDFYAIVCDGMGGPNGGGIAASLAVETLVNELTAGHTDEMQEDSLRRCMEDAANAANRCVFRTAMADENLQGMGTTLVLCVVHQGVVLTLHAGDSRLYRFNQTGQLTRVTKDHSMVQTLVDHGEITPAEARIHPDRNLITNALGIRPDFSCEFTRCEIDKGNGLLLCSDGLSNELTDEQIALLLAPTPADARRSAKQLTRQLMDAVEQTDARDNATVLIGLA